MSAWSYGGETSTTSIPTTGSSRQIRRTASSSWRDDSPPGSGVPVPGAEPGSHDVDVHRQEDALALVGGDGERLGQALREAAVHDLGHLVASACSAPPSSPASPAAASSPAARSAGTGRHAAHRTRSVGASAGRDPTASRTRCHRCRRGRRSGSSTPDPGRARWRSPWRRGRRSSGHRRGRSGWLRPRPPSAPRPPGPAGRPRCRRSTSRRRRRRRRSGRSARRCAGPATAGSRRAAGSRSSGSPAARSGCRSGRRRHRRTALPGSPRRRRRRSPARRGRTRRTPRKVMSGPNCAPYRVMTQNSRCSCCFMLWAASCRRVSPRKNAGSLARCHSMKAMPIRMRPRPRTSTRPIPKTLAPLP